jgi:hypothetical protein
MTTVGMTDITAALRYNTTLRHLKYAVHYFPPPLPLESYILFSLLQF